MAPGAPSRSTLRATVTVGVVGVSAAAAIFLLSGGGTAAASGGAWLKAACRSPLFLSCGLITILCVLALAVLCGAMWAAGASQRGHREKDALPDREQPLFLNPQSTIRNPQLKDGQDGTATLEFAMVLPIAVGIVLLMIQSSMLMGGNLCVNYAAFCAARTAIVAVPRDMGADEPRNVVGDIASSAKRLQIKRAAVWAMLPVSCASTAGPSADASALQKALTAAGPQPYNIFGGLSNRLGYAQEHTTADLAPSITGTATYDPNEDLRVRVEHDFYLSVPYAGKIFSQLSGDGVALDFGQGQYGLRMKADCRLTNEGAQDFVDVETFPRDQRRN